MKETCGFRHGSVPRDMRLGKKPSRHARAKFLQTHDLTVPELHAVAVKWTIHLDKRYHFGLADICHGLHAVGYARQLQFCVAREANRD
ncbi:hypothetical protein HYPDE_25828 [Hyphomicrobium denitrificans 1NES1]|uniref:Uncharacterized protein n=1 Tax=Hyphomicrobium denitrificans 1NES1 TaxID=670307 RepID=N0B1L7_9HYPH|nr:hypothetical protein HYPDE_25828 [Hyphomicrobium denitrificans 1NES1]